MKLYFIFTVCLVGTSFGNSLAQKQQVTLNLKNVSLYELFNQIKEQTGLRFLYNAEQLDGLANVSVQAQNEKVSDVLNKVFSGKALTYDCDGKVIIVKKQEILPQTIKAKIISGKVTDYRYSCRDFYKFFRSLFVTDCNFRCRSDFFFYRHEDSRNCSG